MRLSFPHSLLVRSGHDESTGDVRINDDTKEDGLGAFRFFFKDATAERCN